MLVKVIRVGEAVVDYHLEAPTTVGAFLSAHGIAAEGRSLVLNGESVTAETAITGDSTLLIAPAVKGGIK